MTTPKAKKYRIRRRDVASKLAFPDAPEPKTGSDEAQSDAEMDAAMRAAAAPKPKPARTSGEQTDAEILAEGLTGRQLRIARRIANRNGLDPKDDFDAVRMLRAKGIDPFAREAILDLVADTSTKNLPQTVPDPKVPSPQVQTEADVAREVTKIQKDIAKRHRKRVGLLLARLSLFVFLPTFFTGYYFFKVATPMFATHSEFVIQSSEQQSSAPGLGGIMSGTMLATTQDAVAVQSYLHSREAMLRLDEDLNFRAVFSDPEIDRLQRLAPEATQEDVYAVYKKRVKISFDPTEGIVRMEIIAPDPQTSKSFSEALLTYAEEQIDDLTLRLREDQMKGARESFEDAEAKVVLAQTRVLDLQEERGVLSAELEVSSLMTQISALEVELNSEGLRLQELLDNARPNQTRVSVLEANIARLEDLIAELRSQMTDGGADGASLARISGELVIAQAELATRQELLSQSLQQVETARIEANRQVRYLSTSVSPIAPDEASYPRALENTFLAFLAFAGVYLMISLTASVLREQVSG